MRERIEEAQGETSDSAVQVEREVPDGSQEAEAEAVSGRQLEALAASQGWRCALSGTPSPQSLRHWTMYGQ
jgi:hypothetical protein